MNNYGLFITTFIEISASMILFNTFNKQNKNKFEKSFIITLVLTIVVVITNSLPTSVSAPINFLTFFFMLKLFYKKEIKGLLMESSFIIVFIMVIEIILDTMVAVLNRFGRFNNEFLNDFTTNIILVILCFCVYAWIPNKRFFQRYLQRMRKLYFLLANLLIYSFLLKLIWEQNRDIILQNRVVIIMIPVTVWVLNLIFIIYNETIVEQKKSLEIYNQYNPIILDLIEEIRRRQHDFKNHLATIYGIISTYEEKILKDELKNYLESLQNSFVEAEELMQIKNRVLTAILYAKSNEAKKNDINFHYTIEDGTINFPLKDYEFSEVLNNLIDNAFEAVMNLEAAKKSIYLKAGQNEKEIYIEVENTGSEIMPKNVLNIFRKGFTSKKEAGHGYGLYNVKKIVQSYGGRIEVSFKNEYIVFKIAFYK